MISTCAEVDRYLRESLNINLGEDISEEQLNGFYAIFPALTNLSLEQINRLLLLFGNIRNINAHLYSNKPLYLDEDLANYFKSIIKPSYEITQGKELTIYGMYFVILFLCQRYQAWGFMTSLLSKHYFVEIKSGSFQTDLISREQKEVAASVCGKGKPNYHFDRSIESKVDVLGLNNLCYQNMTTIFFDLERTANWSGATFYNKKTPSLAKILSYKSTFSENSELLNRIMQLRNDWFHGKCLYDYVEIDGKEVLFTIGLINSVLLDMKQAIANDDVFGRVLDDIDNFGRMLVKYYSARLIEVTYKILDTRLLTIDKVESRLSDADIAYERLISGSEEYYDSAMKLLSNNKMDWVIISNKFLDFRQRTTVTDRLYIMKIHSDIGFDIGGFHTDKKDICLAEVDLPEMYQNTINGRLLKDYVEIDFKKHSSLFVVCNLE